MPLQKHMFDRVLEFDPGVDFEAFFKQAPARWTVYLMTDGDDRPVQLLCVKNLRASLKRRLGTDEQVGPTRRVNYREIVRKIHFRRVDSAFEADLVYLDAARAIFPETYRGMTGLRPAWFVHVNPDAKFPRYVKTHDLTERAGMYFGPIEDKHAAQKLVHLIEDSFDLCRDFSILTQSPNAGPCTWKQMGKCVGPCDGSISLDAYRQLVAFSAQVLSDPQSYIDEQSQRMQEASRDLRFETAAKIKQHIDQVAKLGRGPMRHVRPLDDFRFVTLQRGPRERQAKVFLVTPGKVEEVAGLIREPMYVSDLMSQILRLAETQSVTDWDANQTETIEVVSQHLFQAKSKQGVFLPLSQLDGRAFARGYRELLNQKTPDESEGEGVTRELAAM